MSLSITSIAPSTFDDGRYVTLTGSGFGTAQGSILIGGVEQTISAWSDTSITFNTVRGAQSMGACRVDVVPGTSPYTPTDIITNQSELDTFLAQSAATLEGKVAGVQYNATPYTIARTQLRKNYGAGGLVICGYGSTTPVLSSVAIENCTNFTLYGTEVADATATSGNLISVYTQTSGISILNNAIHGKYYDPNGDYSAGYPGNAIGINRVSNGSGSVGALTILGNTIYDCDAGINLGFGSGGDWLIQQNEIYRCYNDGMKFSINATVPTAINVLWNIVYDLIGVTSDAGNPHPDFIQFIGGSVSATGINVNGNILFKGNARGGAQGIFMDDMTAGNYFTANVKGNLIASGAARALSISSALNCNVIGNTVVAGDVSQSAIASVFIGDTQDGGGNVVKNTVARSFNIGTATNTNNHTISAQSSAAYAGIFDGSTFANTDLDTRSKMLVAFNMKAAGSLDQAVNIGAVGSGYVDFDARTLNGAME